MTLNKKLLMTSTNRRVFTSVTVNSYLYDQDRSFPNSLPIDLGLLLCLEMTPTDLLKLLRKMRDNYRPDGENIRPVSPELRKVINEIIHKIEKTRKEDVPKMMSEVSE